MRISGWKKILVLCVIVPAVLLEISLQIAAFSVSVAAARPREKLEDAPSRRTVLCVGDSFTYGMGASREGGSYPAQLQVRLDESPSGWQVINAGWPSLNSYDIARAIETLS